jgi:AcrR family transcriptional regulator
VTVDSNPTSVADHQPTPGGDERRPSNPGEDGSLRRQLVRRRVSQHSDLAESEVERVLKAAFDEMADSQSPEPSLRAVLRKAGLSTATFYRHFQSRDELLLVLLDEGSGVLANYLVHRMDLVAEPPVKVAAWIRGFVHQAESPVAARRTRPFAMGAARLESSFPTEHQRLYGRLVSPLAAEIARGNDAGAFHSRDPSGDAWVIFDFVRAAVFRHLLAQTTPDEEGAHGLVDAALRMLSSAPDT